MSRNHVDFVGMRNGNPNARARMQYGDYLAAGYPIASGVIEGACKHVIGATMTLVVKRDLLFRQAVFGDFVTGDF